MRSRPSSPPRGPRGHESQLLFGRHAVLAALANPARRIERLYVTAEAAQRLGGEITAAARRGGRGTVTPTPQSREELARRVPDGALHQGIVLLAAPLEEPAIEDLIAAAPERALVLALDQVTDPHNVGAILRSAAAFGASGVIVTERHSPADSGVLAKAASGAVDLVPLVRVVNLSRALDQLKDAGFWRYGLAEAGDAPLSRIDLAGRSCVVLGAEGEGLRRLTAERCDQLVTIPTPGALSALNVSNAAAIAAWEWARRVAERP